MAIREAVRPGGRSARVQKAVHAAVHAITAAKEELGIPAVAARAGVTPSTIYRRWGDLTELLADVAVERLRPETDPADTGSLRGDLEVWLEQYGEEMSSGPGRAMIRDVLASVESNRNAIRCCSYSEAQLAVIVERAERRGEAAVPVDSLMDHIVAPVMFRILFCAQPVTADYCRQLVEDVISRT